jgi:hypothetical protein
VSGNDPSPTQRAPPMTADVGMIASTVHELAEAIAQTAVDTRII